MLVTSETNITTVRTYTLCYGISIVCVFESMCMCVC